MITFEMFGHKLKIRNDDWKKLRNRFDPDNARFCIYNDKYWIDVYCSLCQRYKDCNICGKCPFEILEKNDATLGAFGCFVFFDKLFKKRVFVPSEGSVSWSKHDDREARRQLNRMQKIMDKIEEENNVQSKVKKKN